VPTVARLLLIAAAATADTRRGAFPLDEPITVGDDVGRLRGALSASRRWARYAAPGEPVVTGPELRCRQTAEALGQTSGSETAPADWHLGTWAGRTLDDLLAADPGSVQAWLTDPSFAPPSGETLTAFLVRVAQWLDAPGNDRSSSSRQVVVCTPAVLRAALTHALQSPPATFWRLDASPLSQVELTGGPARWSLRLGRPEAMSPGGPLGQG
jgi:broad specificity phosphatase PhoE